jgi:threonylcarbamoyladenosine tRNA methylthiotransferase CDKAL1
LLVKSFNVSRWNKMRVFVESFGCSTNLADGEVLAGCLAEAGYTLVDNSAEADVIVYNTCAVKGPTEDRMIEILKRVPESKKLIVTGCLPLVNIERLNREVRYDSITGPATANGIVEALRRISIGENMVALEDAEKAMPSLNLPRARSNPVVSIIPISYGCLGSCAYCCVIFARGRVRSYSIEEIVKRAREDVKFGAREIWVTSQDTACYGRDRNTSLAELLTTLCRIEGDFKIRVGMMTPNAARDILEDLIETFRSEHIFKFIHLPVQSGDDEILMRMRRFYSVDDFKGIVDTFRASFPEVTLSTDVICGFPGESQTSFQNTLRLIEKTKPDVINVSKFFPRPRTAAVEMQNDFVPFSGIKQRSSIAATLAKKIAFERNKRWIGWVGEVLVDEVGKVSGSWIGRNFAYKPIAVKSAGKLLGKTLQVKVVNAFTTHLKAEIVE